MELSGAPTVLEKALPGNWPLRDALKEAPGRDQAPRRPEASVCFQTVSLFSDASSTSKTVPEQNLEEKVYLVRRNLSVGACLP